MKPLSRRAPRLLALQMGVPVVPIHMGGTFDALPRDAKWPRFVPVTLRIGEPIPSPLAATRRLRRSPR